MCHSAIKGQREVHVQQGTVVFVPQTTDMTNNGENARDQLNSRQTNPKRANKARLQKMLLKPRCLKWLRDAPECL